MPIFHTPRKGHPMKNKRAAALMAAFLLLLCAVSLLSLTAPEKSKNGYIADIYQDGNLTMSISLADETETRTLLLRAGNGGKNEIEIRPGSIGVISADCPDKICVRQGFISDSRLPVTCLPNRLVIQLRPADDDSSADTLTY